MSRPISTPLAQVSVRNHEGDSAPVVVHSVGGEHEVHEQQEQQRHLPTPDMDADFEATMQKVLSRSNVDGKLLCEDDFQPYFPQKYCPTFLTLYWTTT